MDRKKEAIEFLAGTVGYHRPFWPNEEVPHLTTGEKTYVTGGVYPRLSMDKHKGKSMLIGLVNVVWSSKDKSTRYSHRMIVKLAAKFQEEILESLYADSLVGRPYHGFTIPDNIVLLAPLRLSTHSDTLIVIPQDLSADNNYQRVKWMAGWAWASKAAASFKTQSFVHEGMISTGLTAPSKQYEIYYNGMGVSREVVAKTGQFQFFGFDFKSGTDMFKQLFRFSHEGNLSVGKMRVLPELDVKNRAMVTSQLLKLAQNIADFRGEKFMLPQYHEDRSHYDNMFKTKVVVPAPVSPPPTFDEPEDPEDIQSLTFDDPA